MVLALLGFVSSTNSFTIEGKDGQWAWILGELIIEPHLNRVFLKGAGLHWIGAHWSI